MTVILPDVKIATIRPNRYRPTTVRTEYRYVPLGQALNNLRGGVTIRVSTPDTYNGSLWAQRVEK
jgi:hypothetical protein